MAGRGAVAWASLEAAVADAATATVREAVPGPNQGRPAGIKLTRSRPPSRRSSRRGLDKGAWPHDHILEPTGEPTHGDAGRRRWRSDFPTPLAEPPARPPPVVGPPVARAPPDRRAGRPGRLLRVLVHGHPVLPGLLRRPDRGGPPQPPAPAGRGGQRPLHPAPRPPGRRGRLPGRTQPGPGPDRPRHRSRPAPDRPGAEASRPGPPGGHRDHPGRPPGPAGQVRGGALPGDRRAPDLHAPPPGHPHLRGHPQPPDPPPERPAGRRRAPGQHGPALGGGPGPGPPPRRARPRPAGPPAARPFTSGWRPASPTTPPRPWGRCASGWPAGSPTPTPGGTT